MMVVVKLPFFVVVIVAVQPEFVEVSVAGYTGAKPTPWIVTFFVGHGSFVRTVKVDVVVIWKVACRVLFVVRSLISTLYPPFGRLGTWNVVFKVVEPFRLVGSMSGAPLNVAVYRPPFVVFSPRAVRLTRVPGGPAVGWMRMVMADWIVAVAVRL